MPTKTPRDWKERLDELPIYLRSKFSKDCSRGETEEEKSCKMLEYEHVFYLVKTLLEEARQVMKEEILKKIPELKVREIKLPQDDLRVLRARQYHNQKLSELSDFIQSL